MKRILITLLVSVLVLGMLPFTAMAEAAPRYTYTVARSYATPPEADGEILLYLEDKYNVDFDIWYVESDRWHEVMSTRFAAGEIPDWIDVKGFDKLYSYVDQELLAELPPEFLKENAPFIYDVYVAQDETDALRYSTIDGKNYGIPTRNTNPFRHVIAWRGDWLEKIGMESYPTTLEDFEKAMYAFTNDDPDGDGADDTYGMSQTAIDLVYGAYGYMPDYWHDRDGKLVFGGVQPEMRDALELLARWYADGVIDREFVTGENQGGYYAFSHPFYNDQIGITCLGHYYHWKPVFYEGDTKSECYLELQKTNPQALETLVYGEPPTGPDGASGAKAGTRMSTTVMGFGVQLEDDLDKYAYLLQIIDEMSADYENYLETIFGIKGEHWDYDEATGFPGLINGFTSTDVARLGILNGLECWDYTYRRAAPRIDWAYENGFDSGKVFNELIIPLESEVRYGEELKKIREETYTAIIRGEKPIEAFDDFVEQWYKLGGQEMVDEANAWWSMMNK